MVSEVPVKIVAQPDVSNAHSVQSAVVMIMRFIQMDLLAMDTIFIIHCEANVHIFPFRSTHILSTPGQSHQDCVGKVIELFVNYWG